MTITEGIVDFINPEVLIKNNMKDKDASIYIIKTKYLNEGEDIYGIDFIPTIVDPSDIIQKDLEFTLSKDPKKYFRPVVELRDDKLEVVANNSYFKAISEQGIENIYCDLINNGLNEELITKFELKRHSGWAPDPEQQYHNFIFFDLQNTFSEEHTRDSMRSLDEYVKGRKILDDQTTQFNEYEENECIEYYNNSTDFDKEEFKRLLTGINDMYNALQERYGKIRSINGIKRDIR